MTERARILVCAALLGGIAAVWIGLSTRSAPAQEAQQFWRDEISRAVKARPRQAERRGNRTRTLSRTAQRVVRVVHAAGRETPAALSRALLGGAAPFTGAFVIRPSLPPPDTNPDLEPWLPPAPPLPPLDQYQILRRALPRDLRPIVVASIAAVAFSMSVLAFVTIPPGDRAHD